MHRAFPSNSAPSVPSEAPLERPGLHAPFLRMALGFYLLALSLGVTLRFAFLHPLPALNFSFALHAHSHTLYFGWAGLGILTLALRSIGAGGRFERWVLTSVVLLASATFGVFLFSGYSPAGIAVSALSLPVWLGAGVAWFRASRGQSGPGLALLHAGFFYGGLAMLGALGRTVLLAVAPDNAVWARLAVFSFLQNFAWFFLLATTGLLAGHLARRGTPLEPRLLRWVLRLAVPFAWLTFPLGVAGATEGLLGQVARAALIPLVVAGALLVLALWRAAATSELRWPLRWIALWWGAKAAMDLGGVLGLAATAAAVRHPAILYLHVELVGIVTGTLLVVAVPAVRTALASHWVHHLGLGVMAAGLALTSGVVLGLLPVPGWMSLSLWLAALGGAGVLLAGVGLGAATLLAHGLQVTSRRAPPQGPGDRRAAAEVRPGHA